MFAPLIQKITNKDLDSLRMELMASKAQIFSTQDEVINKVKTYNQTAETLQEISKNNSVLFAMLTYMALKKQEVPDIKNYNFSEEDSDVLQYTSLGLMIASLGSGFIASKLEKCLAAAWKFGNTIGESLALKYPAIRVLRPTEIIGRIFLWPLSFTNPDLVVKIFSRSSHIIESIPRIVNQNLFDRPGKVGRLTRTVRAAAGSATARNILAFVAVEFLAAIILGEIEEKQLQSHIDDIKDALEGLQAASTEINPLLKELDIALADSIKIFQFIHPVLTDILQIPGESAGGFESCDPAVVLYSQKNLISYFSDFLSLSLNFNNYIKAGKDYTSPRVEGLCRGLYNLQEAPCSLLVADTAPEISALSSLPISISRAYIRVKDELFYINKATSECALLPVTSEAIAEFDTALHEVKNRELTAKELAYITPITGHIRDKDDLYRRYVHAFQKLNSPDSPLARLRSDLETALSELPTISEDHSSGSAVPFHASLTTGEEESKAMSSAAVPIAP